MMAKCIARFRGRWTEHLCQNPATRGEYCGVHDPARRVAREAKWREKTAREAEARLAREAEAAQQARDLAEVPLMRDLIAKIRGAIRDCTCLDEFDAKVSQALRDFDAETKRLADDEQ